MTEDLKFTTAGDYEKSKNVIICPQCNDELVIVLAGAKFCSAECEIAASSS